MECLPSSIGQWFKGVVHELLVTSYGVSRSEQNRDVPGAPDGAKRRTCPRTQNRKQQIRFLPDSDELTRNQESSVGLESNAATGQRLHRRRSRHLIRPAARTHSKDAESRQYRPLTRFVSYPCFNGPGLGTVYHSFAERDGLEDRIKVGGGFGSAQN